MAGQSMIMGEAFGKGYQYGKRKISSLTNEEFNAMTPDSLGKELVTDYNAIIPSLSKAVKQSSDFQQVVIQELLNLPKDLLNSIFNLASPTSQTQEQGDSLFNPDLAPSLIGPHTNSNLLEDGINWFLGGADQLLKNLTDGKFGNTEKTALETYYSAILKLAKEAELRTQTKAEQTKLQKLFQSNLANAKSRAKGLTGTTTRVDNKLKTTHQDKQGRKDELNHNLSILNKNAHEHKFQLEQLNRAVKLYKGYKIKNPSRAASYNKAIQQFNKEIKRRINLLRDTQHKISNVKQLLRNYR